MERFSTVVRSQYGNTYGTLRMILDEASGECYLQMDDCYGPDYFGPLTDEQIQAFNVLLDVPPIHVLK